MKFIKQFGIILVISLIGELLNFLIPLPIPASIYGLVLMLLCLQLHIIPISEVKETSAFLIEIMPLMFIPAAVGLITSFDILKAHLAAYLVITVTSTFLVMVVSGHVTQFVIRHRKAGSFWNPPLSLGSQSVWWPMVSAVFCKRSGIVPSLIPC